ncbi:nicotinate-nucleotide adenylyltransferase [Pontibacillus litoralis]|uniref:Probable nicotinate-nucleotide adenylyltransferase n=1 Tax=Pontibacillus litoralis JSM 072002 TaxID=1385512 RepID=A0A0A5GCM6_9BACI|nr:nicotinate-nucleotide adenylyltransferase [Pontibacillus litoralis]KGX88943.1 nicotinic acid mononucleotide adenylyltransferase [Pontibacillus litoralis JSM 072002]
MKKIGLLGGTFDPPHNGHLLIAEEVYRALDLDEVWFIPSHIPPHKETSTTEAEDRVAMTEMAVQNNDHFVVNTIELERSGPSYTIDTVKALLETYEGKEFYFIMGGDMVEYLPNWHQIEALSTLVTLVGVQRFGYDLQGPYPVIQVEIPMFDVSSTLIRERFKKGESTKYLVPQEVEAYIKERGLYGSK